MPTEVSRRAFFKLSLAASVAWAGWEIPRSIGLSLAEARNLFATGGAGDPARIFPLSVASGDPDPRGITLWTYLAPEAVVAEPQPELRNRVGYEIALDPGFDAVVLRGVVDTGPERGNTVKTTVRSDSLETGATYFYRFVYAGQASRVGRFRTLPAPDAEVERLRLGYVSCQDFTAGFYTALAHMAEEDLDYVIHLGDYIYESVGDPAFQTSQSRPITLPSRLPGAQSLDDYRFLYRTYKSDADLQRLHERFAFITIWDDHEFANDAYGPYDIDNPADEATNLHPARRQAANQAWAEFTPTGIPFDGNAGPLDSIKIYRSFAFGNLAELVMTDERLYRNGPPCGLQMSRRYLTPGCAEQETPGRTMLGAEQKAWFLDKISTSPRVWKLWGNEVVTMRLRIGQQFVRQVFPNAPAVDLYITLDQWDGYQAERAELFRTLGERGVQNFVTITGDLHSFIAGYQKASFDDPASPPVGVSFAGGSVTSTNIAEFPALGPGIPNPPPATFSSIITQSNPHVVYFNSAEHGYSVLTITPTALQCEFKTVSTIKSPTAAMQVRKTFLVPRDRVEIQDVTAAPAGLVTAGA